MNREEIIAQIQQNLKNAGIKAEKLTVQPDPYGGWNIAVISQAFERLSIDERRTKCLAGLNDLTTEWVEFLTPQEAEWAGALPDDIKLEDLPLWPESLARSSNSERSGMLILSDLDEDIDRPIVATFYSLRGGVGRSTALAYTARILAAHRHKVVCADMDLEAPALPVLLGCESDEQDNQGIVELLIALDQGTTPDFAQHLLPVTNSENLFVVPAGRVNSDYARKLRFINPSAWYREDRNPLQLLIDGLQNKLPFVPDVILLDARTGISDLSGPLLFDLADIAIVVFFPHPQAQRGTELLARSLLNTVTRRHVSVQGPVAPELRFLISPIPNSRSKEVTERYKRRPLEWIEEWLEEFNNRRQECDLTSVDAKEITHFVRYREDVATSDQIGIDPDIWRSFEPVAEWIERFIPTKTELIIEAEVKNLKTRVLEELSFSAGTAEQQQELIQDFVQTEIVQEALKPNVPLILGRKGTGKTAIFRFLSETRDVQAVIVHAPAPLAGDKRWILSADGFKEIDQIVAKTELDWRHFWMLYVGVAIEQQKDLSYAPRPNHISGRAVLTQADIIDAFEATAGALRGALSLSEWIRNIDTAVSDQIFLLLDGLDTGFGSIAEERDRRRRSIEGLFGAWMDLGQGLASLRFKIVLREDIWRQLRFDNKSHLYGRSVNLKWSSQTAFLKVVLKQAMRSSAFTQHPVLQKLEDIDVNDWSEENVRSAWSVLVGERMKGAGTTYTRNWVWNRLADANEDHSPRYLLQLFHEAVPWERAEEKRSPYEKTFIRPRALIRCMPRVSEEAIEALREEFGELTTLLEKLEYIGRTPIFATELQKHEEPLSLSREVGLLGVYEESGDQVVRYKVPDLYRYGLKMTRKGQA
jgi:cellulose biosynthesis protein BcsQ